ncbi:hypothetical protein, partial [Pandoraea soli]|uniref:hypothetical protein n=1 Tax=Pandoraea soli TaxID=2508293 RepID=UPI001C2DBFA5
VKVGNRQAPPKNPLLTRVARGFCFSAAISPSAGAAARLEAKRVVGELDLTDLPLTNPPFRNQLAGRFSVDAIAEMGRLDFLNAPGDGTALSSAHGLSRLTSA